VKKYTVVFHRRAHNEALEAAKYIAEDSPLNAARWYEGLEKAIESLRTMPRRCGIAPESAFLGVELRQLVYKSHRIIFQIHEISKIVRVLHVRHGARRWIGEPPEVEGESLE
jgi:plasmid stabilization system protein ParE